MSDTRAMGFVLAMVLLCLPGTGAAAEIWVHPGDTIQAAIDSATIGDMIIVFPGTYSGEGNREISFGGKDLIVVSFTGPEDTIIDCEGEARAFALHDGETRASIISGFSIVNGYAHTGGGISIEGSSPEILNCLFRNCVAFSVPSGGNTIYPGAGGGVYATGGASPCIAGCTFAYCWAQGQDSLYPYRGSGLLASYSTVEVDRCLFVDGRGGAALVAMISSIDVSRCVFFENTEVGFDWTSDSTLEVDANVCDRGQDASYEFCSDSVCLPSGNEWGVQVGALGVGCGPCNTPVETMSWGAIKALYREPR